MIGLFRRSPLLIGVFVAFVAAYVGLTLTAKPDAEAVQRFNLTTAQFHGITLAIAVPYVVIWIIGLFGYLWLRNYANALADSEDGRAFDIITKGILLVVLWLPISALADSLTKNYYGSHPSAIANSIRAVNYLNIIVLLPAFYLIYQGSKQLVALAKVKAHGLTQRQSLWFVVFAALYTSLALSDTARQIAPSPGGHATYYLPDWATVITILIPRLVTWFIGLAAVSNIFLYRQKVKGAIYKEALKYMAVGLGVVVGGITILRVIQSLSSILGDWSLGALLLLIYLLLAVLGFGYFMLAKGAKRLLKIEEL